MTQLQLATTAGVDTATVSRLERGEQDPSFKVLAKLARALDVDLPRLLGIDSIWEFLVDDYLATALGGTVSPELADRLRKMRASQVTNAIVHQARLNLEARTETFEPLAAQAHTPKKSPKAPRGAR